MPKIRKIPLHRGYELVETDLLLFVFLFCFFVFIKKAIIKPHACNGCYDLSIMVYGLNNFMILNIKVTDYRCYEFNISKMDVNKPLNNSVLNNKGEL